MKQSNVRVNVLGNTMMRCILACLLLGIGSLQLSATTYIKEVLVSAHTNSSAAQNALTAKGFTIIRGYDEGRVCDGSYHIYIGYKTTENYNEAITDLVLVQNKGYGSNLTLNGNTYYMASHVGYNDGGDPGDLNYHSGGSDLFLYYTKAHGLGVMAISGLYTANNKGSRRVQRWDGGWCGDGDFNKGRVGSKDVFMVMDKSSDSGELRVFQKEYKVTGLGGRLYQLDLPVVRLSDGKECRIGNPVIYAVTSSGDVQIGNYYIPSSWNVDFNQKTPEPVEFEANRGTWYDFWSLSSITSYMTIMSMVFTADNMRMLSMLWEAPESMGEIEAFKLHATLGTTSGSSLVYGNVTDFTVTPTRPDPGLDMVAIDPYIDYNGNRPGNMQTSITSANPILTYAIWDGKSNQWLAMQSDAKEVNNINQSFEQDDCTHEIGVVALCKKTTFVGTQADTIYTVVSAAFNAKPYHSITAARQGQQWASDTLVRVNGPQMPLNYIEWAIDNPNDSDLMSADQFVIERSLSKDFSEYKALASYKLSDTVYCELVNDDLQRGWFRHYEKDADGNYNNLDTANHETFFLLDAFDGLADYFFFTTRTYNILRNKYTYPSRNMYYRAYRAIGYGIWGYDSIYSEFQSEWTMPLEAVLPNIEQVQVIPDSAWSTNKDVKVRIILPSPSVKDIMLQMDVENYLEVSKRMYGMSQEMYDFYLNDYHKQLDKYGYIHPMVWNKDAKIIVHRFSPDADHFEGLDYIDKTFTIDGKDVKWDGENSQYYVELEDTQGIPYTHYYYEAYVDPAQSKMTTSVANNKPTVSSEGEAQSSYYEGIAGFTFVNASKGTYIDATRVTWGVAEGLCDTVIVKKRVLNDAPMLTANTYSPVTLDAQHMDCDVCPGVEEEYMCEAIMTFKGQTYTTSIKTTGMPSPTGRVSGRLQMQNGSGILGGAKVRVNNEDKTFDKTVEVDEKGNFSLDGLPYTCEGTRYVVTPEYNNMTFTNMNGVTGPYEAVLTKGRGDYTGVIFTVDDVSRISGRVLYQRSTVPVQGVSFLVNGQDLVDLSGQPVVTDATGNFSFLVPKTTVTIQAHRDGHTFTNNGYIYISDNPSDTAFLPTKADYAGIVMTDSTTIPMIGRIAGATEVDKPVGKLKTENVLGDSITLVLELEGNHTAQLYYDALHPDVTGCQETETHLDNGKMAISTDITYEKKRIIVHADANGEFMLHLYPTRYKITQMYAKGYPTFFGENEGYQVIDLSAITDTAHYERIYHVDPTVTIRQIVDNNEVDYVGDATIMETPLSGDSSHVHAIKLYDPETHKYLFDYGVFSATVKEPYQFGLHAEEIYYYNNDKSNKSYKLPMPNTTIRIKNGLCSDLQSDETLQTDVKGYATYTFTPKNTTFSLTGENALRSLCAYVDVSGKQYEAGVIKAYVTGERVKSDIALMNFKDAQIDILDVLRDPPGSGSYAFREKGTTYKWNYSNKEDVDVSIKLAFILGTQSKISVGLGVASSSELGVHSPVNINIGIIHYTNKRVAEYTMTLNERISTSSATTEVGTMADVYIGKSSSYKAVSTEAFYLINEDVYKNNKDKFANGAFRVVAERKDQQGDTYYLATGNAVAVTKDNDASFAYSQRYILGTLIPELERLQASEIASGNQVEADNYKQAITAWKNVIGNEEKKKLEVQRKEPDTRLSVAEATITHTESASSYDQETSTAYWPGISGGIGVGRNGGDAYQKQQQNQDEEGEGENQQNDVETYVKVPGVHVGFSVAAMPTYTNTYDKQFIKVHSTGCGYSLATNNNGYFTVDIYNQQLTNDTQNGVGMKDDVSDINKDEVDNAVVYSHIFIPRGGAMRAPWYAVDSTFVENKGTHIGSQMLKIDNPKIYIDNPVVTNIPADGKATFQIRLSNESEIGYNTQYLIPVPMKLKLDDTSNPYGAKISMDGMPLTDGRSLAMAPGQTIIKTIEVERGAGYDFEGIRLIFMDGTVTLKDMSSFDVHFVRSSSPVRISMPAQNWTLNTLSQCDEKGFYKPIRVEGFDVTYDNFDHIEIQYKRATDDESQWTCLKSYYNDENLYNQATGEKEMIPSSGVIEQKFYGETDPEEMAYDLRAVSFCRQGVGFVTRSSDVISGIKDTRCPEVFGTPKPATGILTYSDVVSLPFNEPIAYNYLDETANFQVMGYVNNADVNAQTALFFSSKENQSATTRVAHNMNGHDFTIDMMFQIAKGQYESGNLYHQENLAENNLSSILFFYHVQGDSAQLCARICDKTFMSGYFASSLISNGMAHVGLAYNYALDTASFFLGGNELKQNKVINLRQLYMDTTLVSDKWAFFLPNATISIGEKASSNLFVNNVRLWNKELTLREFTTKANKRLSSAEYGLMAYWPMDEAQGNVAHDIVGGAHLYLSGVDWKYPAGKSLYMNGKILEMDPQMTDTWYRTQNEDYTMTFFMSVDSMLHDSVNIFRAGDDDVTELGKGKMRIYIQNNQLYLKTNGNIKKLGTRNWADWHHVAISVKHSENKGSVYIDGELVHQDNGTSFDGLLHDVMAWGDTTLFAHLDLVSFWHLALPMEYIANYYNQRPLGTEKELYCLMTFERDEPNELGVQVPVFTTVNTVKNETAGLEEMNEKPMFASLTEENESDNTCPVSPSSGIENIPFSWTSTNNELQINIKKQDWELNHQYLNLTVRGVEDLYGNSLVNPQMWSLYVDKNVLQWDDKTLNATIPYGEPATIKASWKNISGKTLPYNISCVSDWITLSSTMGSAGPLDEQTLIINVDDGLAPGDYMTTIYLTDGNDLSAPLNLQLTVQANTPEWEINPEFNKTMNLVGTVQIQEGLNIIYDMCDRDIVAAFIGDDCVGKTTVTVEDGQSHVYITIYGTQAMTGKQLSFRLWRAQSGRIFRLNSNPRVAFTINGIQGAEKPVQLLVNMNKNIVEHNLKKGWNWISMGVQFSNYTPNDVFLSNDLFHSGDQMKSLQELFFADYSEEVDNGSWVVGVGSDILNYTYSYMLHVQQDGVLYTQGNSISDAARGRKIHQGWNSLAYLCDYSQTVTDAMADYASNASVGDLLKSYTEFAIWNGERWEGSLQYMRPGEGYMLKRLGNGDVDFHYQNNSSAAKASQRLMPQENSIKVEQAGVTDERVYENNMPVIAVVAGQEDNILYLTCYGKEGDRLTFVQMDGNSVVATAEEHPIFSSEGTEGSLEKPLVLHFHETGVRKIIRNQQVLIIRDNEVYNVLGTKME